eukprot:TRINITY_DN7610_c0_g2_i1.p1 TRINITY_DN7610_c0_g2~~TRINITY_DN7610_c0_g2_i1.p1  ORF type:complete len:192 (-),score=9.72 TRINITY_DN7610_c0_g2_i1:51-626(-)
MFGPAGAWCWIDDGDLGGNLARFFGFYIVLWGIMVYLTFIYIIVIFKYRKTSRSPQLLGRIGLFLIALVILESPGTVNRIQNWIQPDSTIYWLYCLHAFCVPLQGFVNCLIYGYTLPVMRTHLKELFGRTKKVRGKRWSRSFGSRTFETEIVAQVEAEEYHHSLGYIPSITAINENLYSESNLEDLHIEHY